MSIIAIRTALQDVLAAVPGITSANAYPPENVGPLPCAWCALNDTLVEYTAGMEVNQHTLPIVVMVDRVAGRLPSNLGAVEVLQEAFMVAMRANYGLPGYVGADPVNYVQVTRIQQDTINIGQVPYIGFVATLDITHKFGVQLGA